MKQRGSTLIILLILLSLLASISISFYEISLQHFKSSHARLQKQQAFLQTEQYPAKKVTNSVSISDFVVVHPGI